MKAQKLKNRSIVMGIAIAFLALFMIAKDAQAQRTTTSVSVKNGSSRYTHKSGSQSLNIEYEGDIEFTEDDKAIKSISKRGYIFFRKTSFGKRKEILAESNSDGTISYEYRVGRRVQEWGKEAEEFLADVLIQVIRTTAIGADSRIDRFYKKGGLDGVLDEISEIKNDHISHVYLKLLLENYDLNDKELEKVAAFVPRELNNDHYISEVFKDHSKKFLKTEKSTEAFLAATTRMKNDHYVSMILKEAMREDLSETATIRVLQAADKMGNDHYKVNVYKDLLDRRDLNDNLINEIVKSAADINNDHYATTVLKEALDRPNLSDKAFENLMGAVSNIGNDHYVTETFRSMLNNREVSDKVVEAIMEKLKYMKNDHYKNMIVKDLFENQDVSEKYFDSILGTVEDMKSDNYASQILTEILRGQELTDSDYAKVLDRVADIDSDHYKVNILKKVLDQRDLKKVHLLNALKTTASIGSDYYKSEVLKRACDAVSEGDAEVQKEFKRVARQIKNDTYYGRVARCID